MLGASSLDKLVSFYSDVLGLKVVGQAEGEFVFFDTGGFSPAGSPRASRHCSTRRHGICI